MLPGVGILRLSWLPPVSSPPVPLSSPNSESSSSPTPHRHFSSFLIDFSSWLIVIIQHYSCLHLWGFQCLQRWSLQHTGSKFPKLLSSKNLFASLLQLLHILSCSCLTIWPSPATFLTSFLPTIFQSFWDLWAIDLFTFLPLIPLLPSLPSSSSLNSMITYFNLCILFPCCPRPLLHHLIFTWQCDRSVKSCSASTQHNVSGENHSTTLTVFN